MTNRSGWARLAVLLLLQALAASPSRGESSKVADAATVVPGGTITWTITFRNELPGLAAVEVVDPVPSPGDGHPVATFSCATDVTSQPPGTLCAFDGNEADWTNMALGRNATATIAFVTRVNASAVPGTIICNAGEVTFTGPSTVTEPVGPTCVTVGGGPEICDNSYDDDLDGATDCADLECVSYPSCYESDCTNDIDDDSNGFIDCDDPQCDAHETCQPERICGDGADDDLDGLVDCADPDCRGVPPCPQVEIDCTNGRDDDADLDTDCDDTDCAPEAPCMREVACGDGIDEDRDGSTDCWDPDCSGSPECGGEICQNLLDDDGDGKPDCADTECLRHPACILTDYDGDGRVNSNDCAPSDNSVWNAPSEIRSLTVTKPVGSTDARVSWPGLGLEVGPGTRYDVVTGVIGSLRADDGIAAASCLRNDLFLPAVDDSRLPGVGNEGYWYLARGQNACGSGTYGDDSLGRERVPATGDCP